MDSELKINGHKVSVIEKGNKTKVIMYGDDFLFYLEGEISFEEANKVMESVP